MKQILLEGAGETWQLSLSNVNNAVVRWRVVNVSKGGEEMSGTIKWNGCCDFTASFHICAPSETAIPSRLLVAVYRHAADMFRHDGLSDACDYVVEEMMSETILPFSEKA